MKHLLTLLVVCLSTIASFAQDTLSIKLPSVWVKADAPGIDTTYWPDVSGNGHHFYPAIGQTLPTKAYLNYNPCFVMDGLGSPLFTTYNFNDKPKLTMVAVYQLSDTTMERGIWTAHKGKNKPMSLSSRKMRGEMFKIKYCDTNIVKPVVNTMTSAWYKLKNDTSTQDTVFLGADDSLSFKGKVAECLVYNRFMSARDLQRVQTYLCLKYGVTLEGLDYMDSRKNILWDHTINENYSNGIFGIGYDTLFGLNQKQGSAGSMPDIVTISANSLAQNNAMNPTVIAQGDFVVLGNNNATLSASPIDSSLLIKTLDRTWMVQVSGASAFTIPTSLKFDISGIDCDSARIWLVIDREGQAEIQLTNTEYIQPDSILNNYAYFNNVLWDIDKNKRDLFTLMFDKTPLQNKVNPPATSSTSAIQTDPNDVPDYPIVPQPLYLLITGGRDMTHAVAEADAQTCLQINFDAYRHMECDIIYQLYPNPSSGSFTLNISLPEESNVLIKLIDLQGRLIQQRCGEGQTSYNFTGFVPKSGSYFIDILSDQQHKFLKLIVR